MGIGSRWEFDTGRSVPEGSGEAGPHTGPPAGGGRPAREGEEHHEEDPDREPHGGPGGGPAGPERSPGPAVRHAAGGKGGGAVHPCGGTRPVAQCIALGALWAKNGGGGSEHPLTILSPTRCFLISINLVGEGEVGERKRRSPGQRR